MITNNTPKLPKMPSLPKSRTQNRCECGCTGLTGNRFVPGHDSKLKGMRLRVEAGVWNPEKADDKIAQLDAIAETFGPSFAEATAIEMKIEWTIEGWAERAA